jgi:hypothetical protein
VVWGLGSWAVLRVLTWLGAWISLEWLPQGTTVTVPGYSAPVLHGVAGVLDGAWLRADALWYLRIAHAGYLGDNRTFAFFPMFPGLVRLVAPLTGGSVLYAALGVASIACALGFVWLFRALDILAGGQAARAAVAGLALFPTSFFLVAPYGEPLLLAAGAGALLAAATERPGLAAVAGLFAALSRPLGVLFALPLAGFIFTGVHRRSPRWWLIPLVPVVGALAWLWRAGHLIGNLTGAIRVQGLWQRSPSAPWATLAAGVRTWWAWQGQNYGPYMLMDILATLFGVVIIVLGVVAYRRKEVNRWIVGGLAAYGVLVLLVPLSTPYPPRPLLSMPRFILALFPLFAGYVLIPRRWTAPVALASAGGLVWLTALYVAARPIF